VFGDRVKIQNKMKDWWLSKINKYVDND
jgi:hypothetical protein